MTNRVLYLLGSAAPPLRYIDRPIRDAQTAGWEVCLGLTPTAAEWISDRIPEMEALTGHPVRSEKRRLWEESPWPPGTASVVAPATLNTVNHAALGLTPNWATGHIVEMVGKRSPLVMMPCVNSEYATHPQFGRSLETLRGGGVRVLFGEEGFVPHEPGQGRSEEYPWHLALEEAARAAGA